MPERLVLWLGHNHWPASVHEQRLIALDVLQSKELDPAIASHDLVISLIPFVHHASVIKSAYQKQEERRHH